MLDEKAPPAGNISRYRLRFIIFRGVVSVCALISIWLMYRPILMMKGFPTNYFHNGQMEAVALLSLLVAISVASLAGFVRLALMLAGGALGLLFAFALNAVEKADELLEAMTEAGVPQEELVEIYETSGATPALYWLFVLVTTATLLLLYITWRQWRILVGRRREP